jgi:hypothetical protein
MKLKKILLIIYRYKYNIMNNEIDKNIIVEKINIDENNIFNNEKKTKTNKTYKSKIKYDLEYQKRENIREKIEQYRKKYYEENKQIILEKNKNKRKIKMETDPEFKKKDLEKRKIYNKIYNEKKKKEKADLLKKNIIEENIIIDNKIKV